MKSTENAYEGENRSLHMKERIGYGVGDFANNMMYTPVNSFFTYFLTNVAGLGAGVVGTILLISRLLDGVSDLIVGSFMEKIHSKHGKARPWLLWWCIPFAISLVLMFTAPDFGTTGKIVYAFLTYNLAVTVVYTAINLPFGSLAALMTKNQTERGYLNISKMVFAFGGGMVVNAFIGVNVYYAQYIMNDDSLVGNLSIFQNIASFAAFAVCTVIIRKVGKQKIAISGVLISFIGYAMVLVNPTSYAVLYTAAIIKGVGNAALSGVMYGMLADTVEYNDWKSGIRAEGLVFSANSIGQKVGSGIGSAVLGWVLAAFGFVSSSASQPASAISGIRMIFLYVPLVIFAAMFVILLFYKLDKEYGHIVNDLEKRAKKA